MCLDLSVLFCIHWAWFWLCFFTPNNFYLSQFFKIICFSLILEKYFLLLKSLWNFYLFICLYWIILHYLFSFCSDFNFFSILSILECFLYLLLTLYGILSFINYHLISIYFSYNFFLASTILWKQYRISLKIIFDFLLFCDSDNSFFSILFVFMFTLIFCFVLLYNHIYV